jgi:hypothetical protein
VLVYSVICTFVQALYLVTRHANFIYEYDPGGFELNKCQRKIYFSFIFLYEGELFSQLLAIVCM